MITSHSRSHQRRSVMPQGFTLLGVITPIAIVTGAALNQLLRFFGVTF